MKPMPAWLMQRLMWSGGTSMRTPRTLSTSAAPEREESARLPCLATGTPAPATMNAAQVEMLYEPDASPPVPTTSIAFGGAITRSIFERIAETAPVISSIVSPRTRSAIRRPPICDGVASPDIIRSKAIAACSRVSGAPVAACPISALRSMRLPSMRGAAGGAGQRGRLCGRGARAPGRAPAGLRVPVGGELEKILQHQVAVLRRDALGVELDAVHRQLGMGEA